MGAELFLMTVSERQWTDWLSVLEEMLQQADVHSEHIFAIHLNSAIETAYARLGKEKSAPNFNQSNATRDC